ncbi:MAG: T9SS type A sorting domain-containing protein [Tenacibaculum sp.]|nr:T9SS type A sorting domain-containing protein [Tenacibaculum sp.]
MKQKLFSIVTLATLSVGAQSIERSVTAVAGNRISNGNASLDFTVGQTITSSVKNGNSLITQGFQQGRLNVPTVELSASSDAITVITTIGYRSTATIGLDPGFDVGNFGGASFDLFTHLVDGSSSSDFTYQSLPDTNYDTMVVPIGLVANSGKEVVFSANNSNLPSGLQVVIEDRTLGVFEILDVTNTYTVQLASSENGIGRFYLHTRFESVWDGNTDSVWATATNWNNDLNPLETSNIRIPNVANSPTVSGEITKSNNLVIEASAALDVSSDGGVIVAGNFDNSGEVSITSTNVSSGTFIVKGTSNGTVSFERTGLQASKWSLITAPVTGQTVKEFIENPANDIRVNPTVTPNRYAVAYYDDSQPAGSKWVYYTADDIITNAITFEKGKSYIVSRGSNGSVTFSGSLTTSDETIAVVADQWNAVGNPYTAYLPINNNANLNFLQDNLSKFDPVNVGVYVWDNGQNKYVAKTLIDAELSLTVGQGFFVKTGTGVSSITFKESQRLSDNTGVQTFSKGNTTPSIKLIAIQDGVEVETKINFSENSTKELDPGYDIGNFKGASFDIFTHLAENSEGKDFTIQSLSNEDVEGLIIPVGITSEANKNISIKVKKEELPQGLNIYLEDKLTGEFVALDNANEYSIKMDNKMDGIGRFYLHTSSKTLDVNDVIIDVSDIKIFKSNTQEITISGVDSNTTTKVQVFSVLGSEVLNEEFKGNNKIVVRTNNVQTGVYIVRIDMNGTVKSKKVVLD